MITGEMMLAQEVLSEKIRVITLTVKMTLQCKSLDEITDAEELAAALKQQYKVDAPSASIRLQKGPADSLIKICHD